MDDRYFESEWVGQERLTVIHRQSQAIWRFAVEDQWGRRQLKPLRTEKGDSVQKEPVAMKRLAFAYAVAEARKLALID